MPQVVEAVDALLTPHDDQDAVRRQAQTRAVGHHQLAADPLADDGGARARADRRLIQSMAGERALGVDPDLGHFQVAPELLDASDLWIDAHRGAGGESGPQDVAGREDGRGTGEHHGPAVEGLLDQRQDGAAEAELPGREAQGGVLVVGAVGDDGPGAPEPGRRQRAGGQTAVDDFDAALEQPASLGLVLFQHESGHAGRRQLLEERLDPRAVAVDHGVLRKVLVRFLGQADLEALLQEGDEVDGEDQEHQEDAQELDDHHQQHHGRVAPSGVSTVARGAQRLSGPLQALPEGAGLAFEGRHAPLIEHGRRQHREEQAEDQEDQTPAGTPHGGILCVGAALCGRPTSL